MEAIVKEEEEIYGIEYDSFLQEWVPSKEVMIKLYTRIANKEEIHLQWQCSGRKPLSLVSKEPEPEVIAEKTEEKADDRLETTEFDFDEFSVEDEPITTPRRTPGKPGANKKRVASLDKIMNDIFRHRKPNPSAALLFTKPSSPRTSPRPSKSPINQGAKSPVVQPSTSKSPLGFTARSPASAKSPAHDKKA